ncbi:MAG TPA: hypothetical protein VFI08_00680, partial [Spirochaetia bacterium]|nr:hypothetical protein [Spirochaetia bacterium]
MSISRRPLPHAAAAVLLVLAAAAFPARSEGDTLNARLEIDAEAASGLPAASDLAAGVERLFDSQLGSLVSVDFGAPEGAPASGRAVRIRVRPDGGGYVVSTDFSADGQLRPGTMSSLDSRVPAASPSSLAATISSDIAFLYFSARGLSTLPLSPPPVLLASVGLEALGELTGWDTKELEPVGISGHGDEFTLCFAHRYLTLGPYATVNEDTARDLLAQPGQEPLQISGAATGLDGELVLLSQQAGSLVSVSPRLGTRAVVPAPGLSALPARLLGSNLVLSLPGDGSAGLLAYTRDGTRGPVRVAVAGSYVSAMDRDAEGNIWAWDAGERRIRVLTATGREIHAIRPLLSASTMPLPQQLAVFDDGSFLLAGSSEVWKFESSGIPVWRLSRIPGRPGESLPASMDLAVDRSAGTIVLLDQQSRRLLVFSPAPTPDQAPLVPVLARLDGRRSADLQQASTLARTLGLDLAAWSYADREAAGGGSERDLTLARRSLLSDKAAAF